MPKTFGQFIFAKCLMLLFATNTRFIGGTNIYQTKKVFSNALLLVLKRANVRLGCGHLPALVIV